MNPSISPTIALVILSKNQEEKIVEILKTQSTNFQKVYILDDLSIDNTVSSARALGATVFTRELGTSFSDHRNWILKKIQEDWTFFLDSDEQISPEVIKEMREVLATTKFDAFAILRFDVFQKKLLQFGEVGQVRLVRLAKTQKGQDRWKRAVHEFWEFPKDSTGELHSPLRHNAHKDISSFMGKLHLYASLEKKERSGRGKSEIIFEMMTYPVAKFLQNYFWRQGFRDGYVGFVYAFLMSYYSLIKRVFWYEDLVS